MNCPFIIEKPGFRVVVVYICVTQGSLTDTYAPRFAQTYRQFPAGFPHQLIVVCNGGPLTPYRRNFFAQINPEFIPRLNDQGFDISSYRQIAGQVPSDFQVCLGESVYFHRQGWLERMVSERLHHGPGMYGFFSSHAVRAHLNTTGFGVDPQYLTAYPNVTNHSERYEFEHGPGCLWRRIASAGGKAMLVTWDGAWEPGEWRMPDNIMTRGDQSNILAFCNHAERFQHADARTRQQWASMSDQPFRV